MDKQKEQYLSPRIEVIKMENEGVIAASSGDLTNQNWTRSTTHSSSATRGYNSASSSDLEDLINDILTVEN